MDSMTLRRQCKLLSLPNFSDIKIEEVAVENGLNASRNHSDRIKEILRVETIEPVEDVQRAVHAERKQIVTGDGFSLPRLTDHEQLWKDCHRLQVDGERPEYLKESKLVVYNERQKNGGHE